MPDNINRIALKKKNPNNWNRIKNCTLLILLKKKGKWQVNSHDVPAKFNRNI